MTATHERCAESWGHWTEYRAALCKRNAVVLSASIARWAAGREHLSSGTDHQNKPRPPVPRDYKLCLASKELFLLFLHSLLLICETMPFGGGAKCALCGKTVYMAEEVVAEGQKWHKACFKCTNCNKPLDT